MLGLVLLAAASAGRFVAGRGGAAIEGGRSASTEPPDGPAPREPSARFAGLAAPGARRSVGARTDGVEFSGFETDAREIDCDEGDVERLGGVVLAAPTGAPVRGARVACRGAIGETDAGGTYALRVPRASLREGLLRVGADGFVERVVELEREPRARSGSIGAIVIDPVVARLPARVRDGRGTPVAGVTVEVGFAGARLVSDANGVVGPVAVGAWPLPWRAWGPSAPPTSGSWSSDAGAWPAELSIELPAAAPVEGVVVDEGGRAVPDASVFDAREPDALVLVTDGEGRFAWPAAAGTAVTLVATKDERSGGVFAFAGSPTRIGLAIGGWRGPSSASPPPLASTPCSRLGTDGPRSRVRVRIEDEAGHPWAGARLEVACEDGPWDTMDVTGPDGVARVEVPDAALLVRAEHPLGAYASPIHIEPPRSPMPATLVVPRRPASREPTDVVPEPPAAACVTGRVLDAAGRPVAGVEVAAAADVSTTDAHGAFRLSVGAEAGEVALRLRAPGFASLERLASAGGPPVVVTLPARGAIRVALAGAPPEGEDRGPPEVRLWTSARLDEAVIDDDRSPFLVDGGDHLRIDAAEGRYVLACRVKPGAWIVVPDVDVRPARTTELTYAFPALHALRVRVRAPSGEPVAGAEVSVASTGAVLGETDAAGTLDLSAAEVASVKSVVPSGEVRLRVASRDFAPALTSPLDTTHDVASEVTLEPGARVVGRLLAADGAPVRGEVSWLPDAGPAVFPTTSSRTEGEFELDVMLPSGRQRLRVAVEGREPFVVEALFDAASPSRDLVLRVP